MAIDPAYDMPVQNWQQGGSFPSPLTLLLEEPDSSPLVQLPCINQSYVLAIMGCLDQLRNPSTWDPASSPAAIDGMLSRVTKLQEMMWGAMDVPCCSVSMRLTAGCVLQYSTDGVTWVDVAGWADNFSDCARASIIAPIPPNPGPVPIQQHACNIAGFLASEVIQKAMVLAASDIGAGKMDVQYAIDILAEISFAFPITYAASLAFKDWYDGLVAQLLSEVTAASTDPALWSLVTCAIYNAIKGVGYVSASNFAAIVSNVASISYTYAWAPGLISGFINNLGLGNLQAMQNIGAVDDVDCTDCGTWCLQYDFSLGMQSWFVPTGQYGTWHAGPPSFWTSALEPISMLEQVVIRYNFGFDVVLNQLQLRCESNGVGSSGGRIAYLLNSSGSVIASHDFGTGVLEPTTVLNWSFANTACRYIQFSMVSSASNEVINDYSVQVHGPGPNPFGADDCTY